MPTVVQFTAPAHVELVECPREELQPRHFRVRTWFSGISAGTELTAFRGSNPYLTKGWDPGRRLFVEGAPGLGYPVVGWGYSEVGEVVEVADDVDEVEPGQMVAGIWGHRSEAVVPAGAHHWLPLSEHTDPMHGVFARVGAIALNAVLGANPRIGETTAIFGQGVIGLLATQLTRLSGADVVAVDVLEPRLALATRFGARSVVPVSHPGGAAVAIRAETDGRGADSAIELSGSYRALHEAIRSVTVDGTVVASGFYQGEGQGLRLGEEFHHNRVQIVANQIGGTPVALGARWSPRRLLTTFVDLVEQGRVEVAPLVTDVHDASDVAAAFERLDSSSGDTLQVVLRFGAAQR